MRNRVLVLITAVAVCSIAAFSQAPVGQRQGRRSNEAAAAPDTTPFDPHDLSGIWHRLAPRGGDRSISSKAPPLTAAGKARMAQNLPARSRNEKPAPDDPADSNDPAFRCNPQGFPRIVVDTAHEYHEVIQFKDRILQLWQEERRPREIWMDGRPVPSGENLENLGPAWYGHSVGHWEGDTLVVETVGLDDRAWVDLFGFPNSVKARVVERYRRTDASTLTLQLTLTDPEYYTEPWISDIKTWKKQPREKVTWFGWYGLFSGAGELVCAPMNASTVNKHGG